MDSLSAKLSTLQA